MDPRIAHIPGTPVSPEPPEELVRIANTLEHLDVTRVGVTTTADGRWALLVHVSPETTVPIPEVETSRNGYPVVYQEDSGRWPVARPAYPSMGE